jgi:hypothetical protein
MVKRQVTHNRMLDLMAAHQKAFDEEVNKAISLVGEFVLFNFLSY